jgi:hypothetical protein
MIRNQGPEEPADAFSYVYPEEFDAERDDVFRPVNEHIIKNSSLKTSFPERPIIEVNRDSRSRFIPPTPAQTSQNVGNTAEQAPAKKPSLLSRIGRLFGRNR